MAHVIITQASRSGDAATAAGTVDGDEVAVSFWITALPPGARAVKVAYVAGLMKAEHDRQVAQNQAVDVLATVDI